ncbi:hypothetical protein L218DRAFT_949095 [Marasmius fiardii PR-910]|nr:hypothetical protein L218DRAFT_949095 [Marasmius fiardii PR-910]
MTGCRNKSHVSLVVARNRLVGSVTMSTERTTANNVISAADIIIEIYCCSSRLRMKASVYLPPDPPPTLVDFSAFSERSTSHLYCSRPTRPYNTVVDRTLRNRQTKRIPAVETEPISIKPSAYGTLWSLFSRIAMISSYRSENSKLTAAVSGQRLGRRACPYEVSGGLVETRCDEVQPVCGGCTRRAHLLHGQPCQYGGNTESEVLQERVSELENRIRELEGIRETPLLLFHPYPEPNDWLQNQSTELSFKLSQTTPSEARASSIPSQPPHAWPLARRQSLLNLFLTQTFNLGFFLNPNRFWDSALSDLPADHPEKPAPGLLDTVYLLGLHLSPRPAANVEELEHHKRVLLSRSLQEVPNMLNSTHPHRIIHRLQAEVLLSTYLFDCGRVLEGRYHLDSAVSLAIGAGLHRIRSANREQTGHMEMLPPPRDAVEEGERINAFWTVYTLSNVWSAVSESPPPGCALDGNGTRIDTPWPLDMTDYQKYGLPYNCVGNSTVLNFLSPTRPHVGVVTSNQALHAQASILLVRATNLKFDFDSGTNTWNADEGQSFDSLNNLIDEFIARRLPSIPTTTSTDSDTTLSTRTIAYVSRIQLHSPFIYADPRSLQVSIEAAKSSVQLLRQGGCPSFVSPIMGMLWKIIGSVVRKEVSRLRRSGAQWSDAEDFGDYEGFIGTVCFNKTSLISPDVEHSGVGYLADRMQIGWDSIVGPQVSSADALFSQTHLRALKVYVSKSESHTEDPSDIRRMGRMLSEDSG